MTNLLYKESRLANLVLPAALMALCLLMLIPAYPLYVGLMYTCLGVFFTLLLFRETNDIYFSMMLPIPKRQIVLGHLILFCIFEIVQLVVAVPVALLRHALIHTPNPVGIEANPALFGSALIMFTIFNFILLTEHYRDAYRLGVPLTFAGTAVLIYIAVAELAVVLNPVLKANLDTVGTPLGPQLAVLLLGIVIFVLGNLATYRVAAARFERVDL